MDKNERIGKILSKLRHLKQYKGKTNEELLKLAESKFQEEQADLDSLITKPAEKKQAKRLLNKYLTEYDIQTIADRNDLNELIYLEILHRRFQEQLNKEYSDNKTVPLRIVEIIHKNIEHISELKNRLGLTRKEEDQANPLKILNQLKVKFKQYINDHKDLFTMKCPYCGGMVLIRRRIPKDFETIKHPFFKKTIFYNEPLLDLVMNGKISKEDAAKVLAVSQDYISWLVEKHYKKGDNAGEIEGRGNTVS